MKMEQPRTPKTTGTEVPQIPDKQGINVLGKFFKVPLDVEDLDMTIPKLAKKYGLSYKGAQYVKERGYRMFENPDFISKGSVAKGKQGETEKFLNEITPININSIETIWGNEVEQKIIKEILDNYNTSFKYKEKDKKYGKKFQLLNGVELSFGDIVIICKLLETKAFRNKEGTLMIFDKDRQEYKPFIPTNFLGLKKSLALKNDEERGANFALESFAPEMFHSYFKLEDFLKHQYGTKAYEIFGPHERTLSKSAPYVFLSNSNSSSKYYLGRDKFTGTKKEINHETVRVSLLDNDTAAVTDVIHGRKVILYTFPLLTKEKYEEKKEKFLKLVKEKNKTVTGSINDHITTKVEKLSRYSVTDYVSKNIGESETDYANRISKLSDTSYVLGNFRSFMSETGLAANNYSWREQLILSDALTSVEQEKKIIEFGKQFKKDGFRTFLSVEKGGNVMGDKIIELTKLLSEDSAKIIFEGYSNILNEADKLKNRMSTLKEVPGVSGELVEKIPLQIYDALLLRTKDILLGAHLLVKNNELNGLKVVNVREAMDGISLMLKILNDIGLENNFSFQEKNRTEQNFKYEIINKENQKKYGLKIFLRPKAEKNAQARVNIELSFDTDSPDERLQKAFHNKVESHTQNKVIEGSVLRLGIDREERNGGQVSLDIGRSLHRDKELSRTGDTLGNLLAIASKEGHHTTESFDPRFAEEETFAQLVKLFENYLVSQKNA